MGAETVGVPGGPVLPGAPFFSEIQLDFGLWQLAGFFQPLGQAHGIHRGKVKT